MIPSEASDRRRWLWRTADPVLLLTVASASVVGAAVASVAAVTYLYLTAASARREPELLFSNSPFNEMVGLHAPFITGGRGRRRSPEPPHSRSAAVQVPQLLRAAQPHGRVPPAGGPSLG